NSGGPPPFRVGSGPNGEGPPIAQMPVPAFRQSPLRFIASSFALAAAVGCAVYVWVKHLRPQVLTPTVPSIASPSASASGAGSSARSQEEPRWAQLLAEGQALFAQHDVAGAQRKFREAQDSGGGHAARGLLAQLEAIQRGGGPCAVASISQPRLGL